MKLFTLAAAALLAAAAQSAAATEPGSRPAREGAVMLYFSKSFGSDQARNRSPLAFGLRFQQQGLLDDMGPVSLLDVRYSAGRKQMLVAGLNAFGGESSEESSSASNDMSRKHPGWTAAAVVAAVFALWCAAECGDDDDDEDEPVYTPGGG
jgi:hypothetical protein